MVFRWIPEECWSCQSCEMAKISTNQKEHLFGIRKFNIHFISQSAFTVDPEKWSQSWCVWMKSWWILIENAMINFHRSEKVIWKLSKLKWMTLSSLWRSFNISTNAVSISRHRFKRHSLSPSYRWHSTTRWMSAVISFEGTWCYKMPAPRVLISFGTAMKFPNLPK